MLLLLGLVLLFWFRSNTYLICLSPFCNADLFSLVFKTLLLKAHLFLQAYKFCQKVLSSDNVNTVSAPFGKGDGVNFRWYMMS